jgi:histone deacetylase 1/2
VKNIGPRINKLSDRSKKMVFLGYEAGTKGYWLLDPSTNRLHVSRDVVFKEDQSWHWSNSSSGSKVPETFTIEFQSSIHSLTIGGAKETAGNEETSVDQAHDWSPPHSPQPAATAGSPQTPPTPQAPKIQWATPPTDAGVDSEGVGLRFRTLSDLLNSIEVHDFEYSGMCLLAADEPSSVDEALEEKCCREAMQAELQSIHENKTWVLSDLPKGQKVIGLKWVFKVKRGPSGNIVKHKA